jgi:transposase-like protein
MNFFEFNKQFPTELACIEYFIKIRYNNKVVCKHCTAITIHHRKAHPKMFQCTSCNNSFSIFKGTIFEKSDTDLRKWMYAIHLFLNSKKGISGYQLQREIGVTYKCAWRMLKQIRLAMGNPENNKFIGTLIEIDETYVGGKPRKVAKKDNDNNDDDLPPLNKRGRGTKKNVIVGCVDRINKMVFTKLMIKNKADKKLTGKQLLDVLNQVVVQDSTIISDEFKGYNILAKKTKHIHLRVDHTREFVVSGNIHTNNIENFWGTLKRGILGIYHHVSAKHLQKYVDEFAFRYNTRENDHVFDLVLKQTTL